MDPWSWTETTPGRALLAATSAVEELTPAAIERLRRLADAETARRAIEIVDARRRAKERIEHAEELLLDRAGAEMATSTDVARWKARRFAESGARRVLDLCAGIGAMRSASRSRGSNRSSSSATARASTRRAGTWRGSSAAPLPRSSPTSRPSRSRRSPSISIPTAAPAAGATGATRRWSRGPRRSRRSSGTVSPAR